MPDETTQEDKEAREIKKVVRNVRLGLAIPFGILLVIFLITVLYSFVGPTTPTEKKDFVQAVGVLVAGFAGVVGLFFTWRNLRLTRENTDRQLRVAREGQKRTQESTRETLRITEQGQITERFTRAIEQLGATKDSGEPKLELRLGGIYALERIAKDSPKRDYSTIMEVLQAYIRENAQWTPKESTSPEESTSLNSAAKGEAEPENVGIQQNVVPKLPLDIQSILDVLKRLRDDPELEEYLSPPDLRRTNLEGAHLTKINLEKARLYKSNLKGTRLSSSHLRGVDLEEANLQKADLKWANLSGANLWNANISKANLSGADLWQANLSGAEQRGGELVEFRLIGASPDYAAANLQEADLREAKFKGADLREANLQEANLQGANLEEANLQGAYLWGADLREADLREADLRGAYLVSEDARSANLRGVKLQGADLREVDLQGADFGGATLQGADLRRARLQGAKLQGATLQGADLRRVKLQGAKLQGADLQGAVFRKPEVAPGTVVNVEAGMLEPGLFAALADESLGATALAEANLSGADLRGAVGLVQHDIEQACGNEETKLPEGPTLRGYPPAEKGVHLPAGWRRGTDKQPNRNA